MDERRGSPNAGVRLSWSRSDRPIPRRVVRPLQALLAAEVASGLALLGATVAALTWANGPWRATYGQAWGARAVIDLGSWSVHGSLRDVIGEGVMAVFFLVASLEIKRELLTGELRDRRTAALPVIAAVGGMLLPAAIFILIDEHRPGSAGWGIAMPTDIAFALGVLALAARRAPAGLKAFLLALAIVDDLGSIVVVALFYSHRLDWPSLLVAAAIGSIVVLMRRIHVRAAAAYLVLGVAMWFALHGSGISPTLAGVALGFLTPASAFQRPRAVSLEAHRVADETVDDPWPPDADASQWLYLARLAKEAVSPLARLEELLYRWATFVIVPLFALANAGVRVSASALRTAATSPLAWGIVAGRLVGKSVGISVAVLVAVRLGVARLPNGVRPIHVLGAAAAAGVPFTVSIFIAELSLPADLVEVAKLAVLVAALLSAVLAFAILRRAPAADVSG